MPADEKWFHVMTELIGVGMGVFMLVRVVPVLDEPLVKTVMTLFAFGNILVDGYLVGKWLKWY